MFSRAKDFKATPDRSDDEYVQTKTIDFASMMMGQLKPGVQKPPKNRRKQTEAIAFKRQGDQLIKTKEYTAAVEAYTQALQLDPDLMAARSNRALAYLQLGQPQIAIQDCDEVLRLEYSQIKAILRRAAAYERLGPEHEQKALKGYIHALWLEPDNPHAAKGLARLEPAPAPGARPPETVKFKTRKSKKITIERLGSSEERMCQYRALLARPPVPGGPPMLYASFPLLPSRHVTWVALGNTASGDGQVVGLITCEYVQYAHWDQDWDPVERAPLSADCPSYPRVEIRRSLRKKLESSVEKKWFRGLQPAHGVLLIHEIYVADTHMREGVGSALVDLVKQHAKRLGAAWLYAYTTTFESAALPFFKSAGFQVMSRISDPGA